jgi:hypothetical protein
MGWVPNILCCAPIKYEKKESSKEVISQRVFKKLTLFQAEILRCEFRIADFLK